MARSSPFHSLRKLLEKRAKDLYSVDPNRENLDPWVQSFLEEVSRLSQSLENMAESLRGGKQHLQPGGHKELPGYIRFLVEDLKHSSSDLAAFKEEFHHNKELKEMLERLKDDVIVLGQAFANASATANVNGKNAIDQLLNQMTGASFFSSVTATTLQLSYQTRGALANCVNAFWFISMVFSVTAVGICLLGLAWRNSNDHPYRLPLSRLSVERWPSKFLAVAVACFSIGFVLFSYASAQSLYISIIVTALGVIFATGILVVTSFTADVYLRIREFYGPRAEDSEKPPAEKTRPDVSVV